MKTTKTTNASSSLLLLILFLVIHYIHGQEQKRSYVLKYTGTDSGITVERVNVQLIRVGQHSIQLVVSNVESTLPKELINEPLVRVSLGSVFAPAVNISQCEKFVLDVNRETLEPMHLEQLNCKDSNLVSMIGKGKMQQILFLRNNLKRMDTVKSGYISFEGVAVPKIEKEEEPSFFRKYWYFIIPGVLMLIMSSIGIEEPQQQQQS